MSAGVLTRATATAVAVVPMASQMRGFSARRVFWMRIWFMFY